MEFGFLTSWVLIRQLLLITLYQSMRRNIMELALRRTPLDHKQLIIASREIRCQLVSIFAPAAPLCSLITQLLVVVHNGVQCNGESCERVLKEKPELCDY